MDLKRRARTCMYDTKIRWLISAWSNASNLKTVTNIAGKGWQWQLKVISDKATKVLFDRRNFPV